MKGQQSGKRAELIRLLEAELDVIEGGGYGQPAGEPRRERPMFERSLVCIDHWFVPGVSAGCSEECALMDFVPAAHRRDRFPCHAIVLNEAGDTVRSLEGDQERLEREVKSWLRRTIERLKREEDRPGPDAAY